MSKYEEALDELFMWATNGYCALEYGDENYVRLKAVMQELVDKATPKKVNNEENHYVFETYELSHVSGDCPNCGSTFYYDEYETLNYCQHCGQALGWSKDENC